MTMSLQLQRYLSHPSPLTPQGGWPGRHISVWHCGGLSVVLLQLKDPVALFMTGREFLSSSGFLFRRDMTD